MGSSYAAGPGVTVPADNPPGRCQRSTDNYAHQLARRRQLDLVDASCGGATTAHVLGPWLELPAQIDAVTPDTRLVTVTIGGNDVGFVGKLMVQSCESGEVPSLANSAAMCKSVEAYARNNPEAAKSAAMLPDDAAWAKVSASLDSIAQEVHRRAPGARLVFIDYIQIVPAIGSCPNAPLSQAGRDVIGAIASRLAHETAAAARRAGAGLVQASELSRGHDACAKDSWAMGFVRPEGTTNFAPYHPNLAAMTAIAEALDKQLGD